jgi:hypothetical protein
MGAPAVERELAEWRGVAVGGVVWLLLQRKLFFFCWQSSPLASQTLPPLSKHFSKIIPSLFRTSSRRPFILFIRCSVLHLHSIGNCGGKKCPFVVRLVLPHHDNTSRQRLSPANEEIHCSTAQIYSLCPPLHLSTF